MKPCARGPEPFRGCPVKRPAGLVHGSSGEPKNKALYFGRARPSPLGLPPPLASNSGVFEDRDRLSRPQQWAGRPRAGSCDLADCIRRFANADRGSSGAHFLCDVRL